MDNQEPIDSEFPMDNGDSPSADKKVEGLMPAVPHKRMITWDEVTGLPVPTDVPILEKPQVEALALTTLALPYRTPPLAVGATEREIEFHKELLEQEKEFVGMNNGEVMMVRMARAAASGDLAAADKLLDRVLGKPKQSSEVKTMSISYEQFMENLAKQENNKPIAGGTVVEDVEIVREKPTEREKPVDKPAEGFGECKGLGEEL